jgi:hypothetical protein
MGRQKFGIRPRQPDEKPAHPNPLQLRKASEQTKTLRVTANT